MNAYQVRKTEGVYPNIASYGVTHIINIQGSRGAYHSYYRYGDGHLNYCCGGADPASRRIAEEISNAIADPEHCKHQEVLSCMQGY